MTTGIPPRAQGNNHPSITLYGVFPTSSEKIVIALLTERQWRSFVSIIGRPDLVDDLRFATGRDRTENRQALAVVLTEILAAGSAEEWIQRLADAEILCGPIQNYVQAMESEPTRALGMVHSTRRGDGSNLRILRGQLSIDGEATTVRRPPPMLGEHTRSVLADHGISYETVESLRSSGTFGRDAPLQGAAR